MANPLLSLASLPPYLKRLLSFDSPENQAVAPPSHPPPSPSFLCSWVASNSFLSRLLSAGPSDDSTRSSSPEAEPRQPPRELEEVRTVSVVVEIPSPGPAGVEGNAIPEPSKDTRRESKLVQTVSLAMAAVSIALFVNLPRPTTAEPGLLYDAHVAFVCLGLFTSLILSMYSILMPGEQWVAWVQRRVMVIAIAFVLLAFVLRTFVVLPVASFGVIWLLFFFVAGGVGVYLVLDWRRHGPVHGGSSRSL